MLIGGRMDGRAHAYLLGGIWTWACVCVGLHVAELAIHTCGLACMHVSMWLYIHVGMHACMLEDVCWRKHEYRLWGNPGLGVPCL